MFNTVREIEEKLSPQTTITLTSKGRAPLILGDLTVTINLGF